MRDTLHRNANIRVLIVGEQAPICKTLAAAVESQPDFTLVGMYCEGESAVEEVEALRPDILLLDVLTTRIDSVEMIQVICAEYAETKVIGFSNIVDDNLFLSVLRAGAVAYVTKTAGPEEVAAAIRTVGAGASYLPSTLAHRLIHHFSNSSNHVWRRTHSLTPREREVLRLVGEGCSNRKIAQVLDISAATVRIHVRHAQKKLGLETRPQLASFAEQYAVA